MSLSFLSEGTFIALGEIISKNLFFYFVKNQKSTNYTPITSWSVFDEKAIRQNSSAESSASNFITPESFPPAVDGETWVVPVHRSPEHELSSVRISADKLAGSLTCSMRFFTFFPSRFIFQPNVSSLSNASLHDKLDDGFNWMMAFVYAFVRLKLKTVYPKCGYGNWFRILLR